jgi:hypothetical protein
MSDNDLSDAVRPLANAIKAELHDELLAELRADIRATKAEAQPECVMLSIAKCRKRYGVGRGVIKELIRSGRLRAVERKSRGGRVGQFIHLKDAERILAGVSAS